MTLDSFLVEMPSRTVLIRVKGDSMRDAGILDGDLAVVERAETARSGQLVVAVSDDEFTLIAQHPIIGSEILRHIDYLKDAVPGARHHQEKYDGTGYPHGLAGNDIPYNARIIAVADPTPRPGRLVPLYRLFG